MSLCIETTRRNGSSQVPRRPPRICACIREEKKRASLVCSPLRLQSAHSLLSGCLTSSRRVFALRSVVALSGLYIVLDGGGGARPRCVQDVKGLGASGCVTAFYTIQRLNTFAPLPLRPPRRVRHVLTSSPR